MNPVLEEAHENRKLKQRNKWTNAAIASGNFNSYQKAIIHDWLRILTLMTFILIPLFFVLDNFMMPQALLPRFALYRAGTTVIALLQFFIVLNTKPGRWSYFHAYIYSLQVTIMVVLMTLALGGFSSSYYAGLILVIIAGNLFMPWHPVYTFLNTFITISMYIILNLISNQKIEMNILVNNLFFLSGATVLTIGISYVRFNLIKDEFKTLIDLCKVRDDLQAEKEVVEDKTRSLKSLLDVSGQGFLSFDSNFMISSEYSRECFNIFGRDIKGVLIDELIFNDEKSRMEFRKGLNLFFEGKVKSEIIFEYLDNMFKIRDKIISAAYKEIHGNRIMVVLTDITGEMRRKEESRKENEKWDLVRKVLKNKQAFSSFDREAEILFAVLDNQTKAYQQLLQDIHTLKGNSGFLGFIQTQQAAHEFEDYLTDKISLGEDIHMEEYINKLKCAFAEEMKNVTDTLGTSWRMVGDLIEIPKFEYLSIEDYIKTNCPNPSLTDKMEGYRRKPLSELLSRFPIMAEQISLKFGKRIAPVNIVGGEIRVIPEDYEELISTFAHIIRNNIDHGIELPYEREAKGKPAAGVIGIEITQSTNEIVFKISDDGRGIQFDKVDKRARQLGLIKENQNVTVKDHLSFLFRDNFSTTPEVSEISGRGIGLAALRTAVKKIDGQIKVKTMKDQGTVFSIQVPANRPVTGRI